VAAYAYMHNRVICSDEFRPYVDKFMQEAKSQNVKFEPFYLLYIRFSDKLPIDVQGRAPDSYSTHQKFIFINKFLWSKSSASQRENTIAHELGHAVLHRKHTEEKFLDKSPFSIMNPNLMQDSDYQRNVKHYWKELFSVQGDLAQ
jgi:hypothetical protein